MDQPPQSEIFLLEMKTSEIFRTEQRRLPLKREIWEKRKNQNLFIRLLIGGGRAWSREIFGEKKNQARTSICRTQSGPEWEIFGKKLFGRGPVLGEGGHRPSGLFLGSQQ